MRYLYSLSLPGTIKPVVVKEQREGAAVPRERKDSISRRIENDIPVDFSVLVARTKETDCAIVVIGGKKIKSSQQIQNRPSRFGFRTVKE